MKKEIILSTIPYSLPMEESPVSLTIQLPDGRIKAYGWDNMSQESEKQFNFIKFIGKDEVGKVVVLSEEIGWRQTSREGLSRMQSIMSNKGKCYIDWEDNQSVKVNTIKVNLYRRRFWRWYF